MIIDNITLSGFKNLYNMTKAAMGESETKVKYPGPNISSFLNHVRVTLRINELTAVELICLNKSYSNFRVLNRYVGQFVPATLKEEYGMVSDLVQTSLMMKDDLEILDDPRSILPLGCIKYDVILTIEGIAISSLCGINIHDLFNNGPETPIIDEYDENIVSNNLIKLFMKSFYHFQLSELSKVDISADSYIKALYHDYVGKRNSAKIAHVNTPCGAVNFFGNTSEGLSKEITAIKESPLYEFMNNSNIEVFITIRSSFLEYLDLLEYVVDTEDIKLCLPVENEDPIGDSIVDKYKLRITDKLISILKFRRSCIKGNPEYELLRYNMIISSKQIKYTIKVPFDKLDYLGYNLNDAYPLIRKKALYTELETLHTQASGIVSMI